MTKPFAFAGGKRAKWAVLVFWVLVAGVIAPFAGKLESVQKNEASSFLPGAADSTRVLDIEKRFQGGDIATAIVVYHRDDPTDAGRPAAGIERLLHDPGPRAEGHAAVPPGACPPTAAPTAPTQWIPPTPSRDGKALIYGVPIRVTGDGTTLVDDVDAIRHRIGEGTAGLDIKVTGGAGFSADAVKIFGNIDTTLLLYTAVIVAVLLLLTYRSPALWLIPLITVGFAEQCARAVAYGLAQAGVVINGQTSGVLTVLVFGAGTDYALLIVARYREELRRHEDRHEAMQFALRRTSPAILASGSTVVAGLLCLLVAQLNSNKGLGPGQRDRHPAGPRRDADPAAGLLVFLGRWVFWPFIPRFGSDPHEDSGLWGRMGRGVAKRRVVWVGTTIALGVMALGLLRLDTNLSQLNGFRSSVDSVEGQKLLAGSFPQGSTAPTNVVVEPASNVEKAIEVAKATPGVAQVLPPQVRGNVAAFDVVLRSDPYGQRAFDTIDVPCARERRRPPGPAPWSGAPRPSSWT